MMSAHALDDTAALYKLQQRQGLTLHGITGTLQHNIPLAKHTTWRVGGPAEWLYKPEDLEDLIVFLRQIPSSLPIFWLGLGSNLLVRDGGIRGVVVLTAGLLNEMEWIDEHSLRAEVGVSCAKIARTTAKAGLTGAEFLAGIPGTLGGALAMNAGAWGGTTWEWVQSVETVDRHGVHRRRPFSDYQIGYRHVIGPEGEWFVAATLHLNPNPAKDGLDTIRKWLDERAKKQPIGLPSGGSVFRNPPGDYAARLIDAQGLKGFCIGGASVSEKHANFIINTDHATAADIEQLIKHIQETVAVATGIVLQPEVHVVGEPLGTQPPEHSDVTKE